MAYDDTRSSALSRRDFLKRGGAGLAGAALLGSSPSMAGRSSSAPTDIVFGFGPDESGTLHTLVDSFNRRFEGDIQVRWREMPATSDAYFRELVSTFESGEADIDVFGGDVVWTAELAQNGWIADLSDRFHASFSADDFLAPALDAVTYRGHTWGVPWYTDAGLLFYRRDLLLRNDYTAPPRTWDELQEMVHRIQQQEEVRYGFVFQGAEYEGGVANACEYIWNAGGHIMTQDWQMIPADDTPTPPPSAIRIESPEAARGFDTARRLVADGIAPGAVTRFQEQESWEAFLQGDAVFMRNWPFVYGLVRDPNLSRLTPEQVSVAPLPTDDASRTPYSCLGGWNLMIYADTSPEQREAAWTFIDFATSAAQQKNRALGGSFLPTRRALYDDPEIIGAMPVIDLGRTALENARPRPASPYYSQMSPHIARAFTRTLQGDYEGTEAVRHLQRELQALLQNH